MNAFSELTNVTNTQYVATRRIHMTVNVKADILEMALFVKVLFFIVNTKRKSFYG